ncbi:MAG: hypothetical protein V5B40_19755, partial [Candidatus Accumulibacter meliphilus]|uniref:hypothetical protein n=1 Tax=Candidatus Accumulibacter meliphilus TaxID=2211374 RepID=UPI002FC2A6F4
TTFTYYPANDPDPSLRGQLATVTNAIGHVTQVTAYDLNGNPLTVIGANGTPQHPRLRRASAAEQPRGRRRSHQL